MVKGPGGADFLTAITFGLLVLNFGIEKEVKPLKLLIFAGNRKGTDNGMDSS